jgi:hypothetical protein
MRVPERPRTATAILAMATLALAVAPVGAFQLQSNGSTGVTFSAPPWLWTLFWHWDLRELPQCAVPWSSCGVGTADVPGTGEWDEVLGAISAWSKVQPGLLGFLRVSYTPGPCHWGRDDWNVVYWEASAAAFDSTGFEAGEPPDGSGQIRVGFPSLTMIWLQDLTSGRIRETDVVLNATPHRNFTWVMKANGAAVNWAPAFGIPLAPPGSPYQADVRTVVTHELGHVIGLEHHALAGSIMDVASLVGSGVAQHALHDDDRDGFNFLYSPDLGDAPDPWQGDPGRYPSLVHGASPARTLNDRLLDSVRPGAEHLFGIRPRQPERNFTYEWLGPAGSPAATADCEAEVIDRDELDDGVEFLPNPAVCGRPVRAKATVTAARDPAAEGHAYDPPLLGDCLGPLWLSAWADLSQDGIWQPGERFLHAGLTPAVPEAANATETVITGGAFLMPPVLEHPKLAVWVRARLDYLEDVAACRNLDGTLAGPEGAAQFGEVEDYPLSCSNPYRRSYAPSRSPVPYAGLAVAYAGDVRTAVDLAGGGGTCPATPWPPGAITLSYDPARDETVVEARDPALPVLPPGASVDVRRCHPPGIPPLAALRSWWIPETGPPGPSERVPSTHVAVTPRAWGTRVVVGALDDSTGGWIAPQGAGWDDALDVTVSYRIAPAEIPLERLDPCDPMVAALPSVHAGIASLVPGRPYTFVVEPLDTTHVLLVEVASRSAATGNRNLELFEFTGAVQAVTGAPGPSPAPRLDLAIGPNPSGGESTVGFTLAAGGAARVVLVSVDGRTVHTLADRVFPPGRHVLRWDGRDDSGGRVPPGVYLCLVEGAGARAAAKVIRTR